MDNINTTFDNIFTYEIVKSNKVNKEINKCDCEKDMKIIITLNTEDLKLNKK